MAERSEPTQTTAAISRPSILPRRFVDNSYRQHTIAGLTTEGISAAIGFEPNVTEEDDADKVTASWAFEVDGAVCAVWSYRGSEHIRAFSAFGPRDALVAVFGEERVS